MPGDEWFEFSEGFLLVVTWTTASVTNPTLNIREYGAHHSSAAVNRKLFSHVLLFLLLVLLRKKKIKRLQHNQQSAGEKIATVGSAHWKVWHC